MLSQSSGDLGRAKAVFTTAKQALAFLSLQGMPWLPLRGKCQEMVVAERSNVKQKKKALGGAGFRFAANLQLKRPADGASNSF
jgi:hypothetical protein